MGLVVGVDGATIGKRRGWIAIALRGGAFSSACFHDTFEGVLEALPSAECFGVDMPIGLVDQGDRGVETVARRFLERRRSSVFPAPVRPVLAATDYATACRISEQVIEKRISKQTWALLPKIRELDALKDDRRIHEVHPEVSFAVLAGAPLALSKKSWGGQIERRRLLRQEGIELPDDLGETSGVPPDDVLDAAIAAWSADRIFSGDARSFPSPPLEQDGTRMIAIWA